MHNCLCKFYRFYHLIPISTLETAIVCVRIEMAIVFLVQQQSPKSFPLDMVCTVIMLTNMILFQRGTTLRGHPPSPPKKKKLNKCIYDIKFYLSSKEKNLTLLFYFILISILFD